MSLKNPVTPPGIDPGTVRLVAQRLNQPRPLSDIGIVLNESSKIDFTLLSSVHISCPPLSTITESN
jgi:hypothetical protein